MSRIGRSPIPVPSGVEVRIEGDHVAVTGPRGTLERELPEPITIRQDDGQLLVERPGRGDQRPAGSLLGRLLGVAGIGEDEGRIRRDEQRAGEAGGRPLGVAEPKAAVVALVRRAGEQDPTELVPLHDGTHRRHAGVGGHPDGRGHWPAHSSFACAMKALCSASVREK